MDEWTLYPFDFDGVNYLNELFCKIELKISNSIYSSKPTRTARRELTHTSHRRIQHAFDPSLHNNKDVLGEFI